MTDSDKDNCVQRTGKLTLEQKIARIAELNDQARQLKGSHLLVITQGVQSLEHQAVEEIVQRVRDFDAFTGANDPHGEHDFGAFEHGSDTIFWKIDLYDKDMEFGSPDPTDPAVTQRVITVMLASEY